MSTNPSGSAGMNLLTRPTLNGLTARTRQDAGRDPFDWFEHAPREHYVPGPRGNGRIRGWLLAIAMGVALAGMLAWGVRAWP